MKGLSRMWLKSQVRFLEGWGPVTASGYSAIFISGSVRGLIVTLGLLPQQEVRYGLYSTNHMKQICMGLAVSEDNIPFMHEVYEGNKHDAKIFPELLDALTERLTNLKITTEEMVLVFDNNSIKLKNIPT